MFGTGTGTLAEYVAVAEDALVLRPPNLSFEQAAAVPVAGLTALQGLRDKGRLQPRTAGAGQRRVGGRRTVTPVVERAYPLPEAADSLSYLGEGHAQGKLAITM